LPAPRIPIRIEVLLSLTDQILPTQGTVPVMIELSTSAG
jgi:hypothetical protein